MVAGMRPYVALLSAGLLLTSFSRVGAQSMPAPPSEIANPSDLDELRPVGEGSNQQEADEGQSGVKKLGSRMFGSGRQTSAPSSSKQPFWRSLKSKIFRDSVEGDAGETVARDADGRWHVVDRTQQSTEALAELENAQQLFRQEEYAKAAREAKRLAKKYEKTPIAEDALFLRAESLFKLDKLPAAEEAYVKLMVDFPTTRYLPQAVQRVYDIAYYWLEDSRLRAQGEPGKYYRITQAINFFDKTRPMFDTNGRAIEAVEKIQQYDPLGPLADDAGMMAAAHNFVNQDFLQAASYYEQVVADQPKSEHAPRAYVLGAQAYLRAYQGPRYDGKDLDDAERLTRLALSNSQGLTEEQIDRLQKDLRVIYLERARRDFTVAEEYRRMRRNNAAIFMYEHVARKYPDTDWARRAQEEINILKTMPAEESGFWSYIDSLFDPDRKADTKKRNTSNEVYSSNSEPTERTTTAEQESTDESMPRRLFSRLPFMSR